MESFLVKDAEALVQEYLADDRVLLKNKGGITFNTSINIFVRFRQTPIALDPFNNSDTGALETRLMGIRERFKDALIKFDERKQAQLTSRQIAMRYLFIFWQR